MFHSPLRLSKELSDFSTDFMQTYHVHIHLSEAFSGGIACIIYAVTKENEPFYLKNGKRMEFEAVSKTADMAFLIAYAGYGMNTGCW